MAEILTRSGNTVAGVRLEDGSEVRATAVLSNATPEVTFMDLLPEVRKLKITPVGTSASGNARMEVVEHGMAIWPANGSFC